MSATRRKIFAFAAVLLAALPAAAHHSATAIFDVSTQIEMAGTLTEVRWVNPHIRLALDPLDTDKFAGPWVFESQPPQWYRRVGVSKTAFDERVGQRVDIVGYRARNGEPFGFMLKITFADGTSFEMVGDRGQNQE